ncbi:MAG: carbon starvation CstA family protein [Balneolaceae bacterium]|nr:carbon starvation CstA family protein [Balneolaceae bacterium]
MHNPAATDVSWFPLLFITIACGAVSGFHGLVASGTTSKQIDTETDARFVGYLGAVGEGALAIITILAVATFFPPARPSPKPTPRLRPPGPAGSTPSSRGPGSWPPASASRPRRPARSLRSSWSALPPPPWTARCG